MSLYETLRSGLEAIVGHRLRSALTVLGILIGIAAVILTVGLGQGATTAVNSSIADLGTNLLIVTPGSSSSNGVQGGFGSATTLTYSDAQDLASRLDCPDIATVAPTAHMISNVVAGSKNWTTDVQGTTASWQAVRSRTLAAGTFFTAADVSNQVTSQCSAPPPPPSSG